MSDSVEISGGHIDVTTDFGIGSSLTDIGLDISSNLHQISMIAICILIYAIGWRKVLPGLILYILYDFINNQNVEDSQQFIYLIITFLILSGLNWLRLWISNKVKKPSPASSEGNF